MQASYVIFIYQMLDEKRLGPVFVNHSCCYHYYN